MADLLLRYLRFLLFNPKPMNQQEETEITEKGKQNRRGETSAPTAVGGYRFVDSRIRSEAGGEHGTEKTNISA